MAISKTTSTTTTVGSIRSSALCGVGRPSKPFSTCTNAVFSTRTCVLGTPSCTRPAPELLELLLCDFDGSICDDLGLDGLAPPGVPFYHPAFGSESSIALEIFSLGSILYVITTGLWPHRDAPGRSGESREREKYETATETLLCRDEFPDVSGLTAAAVIMKCWKRQYESVQDVLDDLIMLGF